MLNTKAMEDIFSKCVAIGKAKNNDYGSAVDNIATTGINGISVRLFDKGSRILSLGTNKTEAQVNDESLRDTLMDMINYATFGVMLLDGTWGKDG